MAIGEKTPSAMVAILGSSADAEPEDEQRQKRDLGNRKQCRDYGQGRRARERGETDRGTHGDPARGTEREANDQAM